MAVILSGNKVTQTLKCLHANVPLDKLLIPMFSFH